MPPTAPATARTASGCASWCADRHARPDATTARRESRRAVVVWQVSGSAGAAGELLAERLQRLVGSQRAAGVASGLVGRDLAAGGVRGGLAGLGLGHLGVCLLLDVLLPAGVRLGVLVLPDRA